MKKQRHWLDLVEYASLIGLGVGSVASFISSQLLFTSAPLSLLVLLNLAHRRRFEQLTEQNTAIATMELDRKLSQSLDILNQQVLALPTPEALGGLKKSLLSRNREVLEQLSSEIVNVQKEMQQRFTTFEKQGIAAINQNISRLEGQYVQLCDSVANLTTRLNQLSNSERVDGLEEAIAQIRTEAAQLRGNLQTLSDNTKPALTSLQDQINHLNRQLQKLPPPFDSTALRQEVAELVRVVADLVPKRDWQNLTSELQVLHQQQESRAQNEELLRRKLQELNQQLQTRAGKADITALRNQINHINRQLEKLPAPFDPTSLQREIAELVKSVANLVPKRDWTVLATHIKALRQQQALQKQFETTLQHELQTINQQLQAIAISVEESNALVEQRSGEKTDTLVPQPGVQEHLETVLNRKLEAIDQQLQHLPGGPQLSAQIEDVLRHRVQDVNQQLQTFPVDSQYELVFDFKSAQSSDEQLMGNSRAILEEALDVTQERLILIWHWSEQDPWQDEIIQKLDAYLSSGRQLDLGWCHLASRHEERFLSPINQRWSIHPLQQTLQTTLSMLLQLKRTYADSFQFKILGTHENFLVSDQTFAILGIEDASTATPPFPDVALKLRTIDPEVIRQCINHFEHPVLDASDVIAYWNRAVTRYDLGDREGAIADFDQVLTANPHDAIAYNYRGLIRYDMGDVEGAMADFNQSLNVDSRQVASLCNRGFVRSEQGDQLGAIADYSLAIQNQPTSAIAYFYRGVACQKYNDPLAAISDFSEAIRIVPTSAISHYYRAQAYQKLENLQGAFSDFKTAARLFLERGNKTNAQKALKKVAKLKQIIGRRTFPQPDVVVTIPEQPDLEALATIFQSVDSGVAINGYANGAVVPEPEEQVDGAIAIPQTEVFLPISDTNDGSDDYSEVLENSLTSLDSDIYPPTHFDANSNDESNGSVIHASAIDAVIDTAINITIDIAPNTDATPETTSDAAYADGGDRGDRDAIAETDGTDPDEINPDEDNIGTVDTISTIASSNSTEATPRQAINGHMDERAIAPTDGATSSSILSAKSVSAMASPNLPPSPPEAITLNQSITTQSTTTQSTTTRSRLTSNSLDLSETETLADFCQRF